MTLKINTDNDTLRLLEIAVKFLQQYFDYVESDAVTYVEAYYTNWGNIHDDDFYHHIGSFHTAVRVHYFIGLRGNEDDFIYWQRDNNLIATPSEALEYFRKHYFQK